MSADGNKIIAGELGGYVHVSNDSGSTWVPLNTLGAKGWISIAALIRW